MILVLRKTGLQIRLSLAHMSGTNNILRSEEERQMQSASTPAPLRRRLVGIYLKPTDLANIVRNRRFHLKQEDRRPH
jgi:hypothetical protein